MKILIFSSFAFQVSQYFKFIFNYRYLPLSRSGNYIFFLKILTVFRKFSLFLFLFSLLAGSTSAQYNVPLYTAYTTAQARSAMKKNLVNYSIEKNFSIPLTDSTEENWQEAFSAMEVLLYSTKFTESKVASAFEGIQSRSLSFQRSLLEVAYTLYPDKFITEVNSLLKQTTDPKIFAMCAEYLIQQNQNKTEKENLSKIILQKFSDTAYKDPILFMLQTRLLPDKVTSLTVNKVLPQIFSPGFLPHQEVMYSLQRKNRDYPGLVIIRNADGNFVRDSSGKIFTVKQLARSITNLPGYLTNGNTPQGIYKMYGFKVSLGNFIGPTANVQLGMPVEMSLQKFFDNDFIPDSIWTIDYYKKLIPQKLREFLPLYESYYAGLAGRSEIIAHGTTIDPDYYLGKPYYPLTPTEGCLCTKEIWNGKRISSDQVKLVNGLLEAGGSNGYCVVIEIDESNAPVTLKDVLPYLPK